jgi:ribosome-binding factor A
MRSQRQLRVGEEIRHALATIFLRGDMPWPRGFEAPMVTVTEVQVSPDLKHAHVFVMPLGGVKLNETVQALNDIAGFFRHEIAQTVELRYTPRMSFKADNSFTYAEHINKILHDPAVAKDLADPNEEEEEEDDQ